MGFLPSTLLGTVTDTLVLWVFSHFIFKTYTLRYIVSPMISFECAVLVNFVMAYYVVWKTRVNNRGAKSFLKHYLGYNLSNTGIFFIKLGILLLIERLSGWPPVFCNILALLITGFGNFALNEWVIFKVKNTKADSKAGIVEELESEDLPSAASAAKAAAVKAAAPTEGSVSSVAAE